MPGVCYHKVLWPRVLSGSLQSMYEYFSTLRQNHGLSVELKRRHLRKNRSCTLFNNKRCYFSIMNVLQDETDKKRFLVLR